MPAGLAHSLASVCETLPARRLNVVVSTARTMLVMCVSLDEPLRKGKRQNHTVGFLTTTLMPMGRRD